MGGDGKANKFNNKNVKKRSLRHRGYVSEEKKKESAASGHGL